MQAEALLRPGALGKELNALLAAWQHHCQGCRVAMQVTVPLRCRAQREQACASCTICVLGMHAARAAHDRSWTRNGALFVVQSRLPVDNVVCEACTQSLLTLCFFGL